MTFCASSKFLFDKSPFLWARNSKSCSVSDCEDDAAAGVKAADAEGGGFVVVVGPCACGSLCSIDRCQCLGNELTTVGKSDDLITGAEEEDEEEDEDE